MHPDFAIPRDEPSSPGPFSQNGRGGTGKLSGFPPSPKFESGV